ncbi:MAG: T9SS type A sorting domain-containing protein [Cyclobacteriaceae bacterium]|nr:T9SS type A sorting domain-containing protein [Cyclobacteriaceae bacterium]
MSSGDVCFIRNGVYRETVVVDKDNLSFKNYNNEYVLITGADVVNAWSTHAQGIYKAAFSSEATMVFLNGQRMNWARWPNEDGNMFNIDDHTTFINTRSGSGTSASGTVEFPSMSSMPNNHWVGAWVIGRADELNWWTANKGQVVASSGKTVTCDKLSWNWANGDPVRWQGQGLGFIIGHLNALDAEKEWVWSNDQIYIKPPAGIDINNVTVEARVRKFGFDLNNRSAIIIEGINFKAAGIQMIGSSACTISNCSFRYGSAFSTYSGHPWGNYSNGDATIHVSGNSNTIENTYIGKTWGHGISVWGNNNIITNCLIEHCNWMGERLSPVFNTGDDNEITHNTLRYAGRDGIELGNNTWINKYAKRATIKHNIVSDMGYFCPDGGVLYTNHQSGTNPVANTEIAYNIWDTYHAPQAHSHGGIYLDNGSSGYSIHHNLIKGVNHGVHINDFNANHNPHDIYIYHNTIIDVEKPNEWHSRPGSTAYNIEARNNHTNSTNGFEATIKSNNRTNVSLSELNAANNYTLKSTSASIDGGMVIPGINDGYNGAAPDLGAYEFGTAPWSAGANITVPSFPDEAPESDQLISVGNAVGQVSPGETYEIEIQYSATVTRDIVIKFQLDESPWTSYTSTGFDIRISNVAVGVHTLIANIEISENIPVAADKYQWRVVLAPIGGNGFNQLDDFSVNNVDCVLPFSIIEGTYYLKNKNSGRRMRPSGTGLGVALEQGEADGTGDLYKWQLSLAEPGYYFITNASTGYEMRIDECGTADLTMIETHQGTGDCVRWQLSEAEAGYYFLTPKDAIVKGVPGVKIRNKDCALSDGVHLEAFDGTGDCVRWALELTNGAGTTSLAINSGGSAFTAGNDQQFIADAYVSGGSTHTSVDNITGTVDDPLYRSERFGNFTYNIPVTNGDYIVRLKFAEIYFTAINKRKFDVKIEGNLVINDIDIFAQVGHDAAYDETHQVNVTDGMLNIQFIGVTNNAKVSAVEVYPQATANRNAFTAFDETEPMHKNLLLYPNPAKGQVQLSMTGYKPQEATIRIIDLYGRIMYKEGIYVDAELYHRQINTSDLSKGLYILQIQSPEINKGLSLMIH